MRLLSISLLLTLACNGAAPCLDACEEDHNFWDACMDEDGLLCDRSIAVDCVDDYVAYQACKDSEFEGDECDGDVLLAEGVVHYCTDADDAVASCKYEVRELFATIDGEDKEEERTECQAEPDDAFSEAFADADCQTFCALFGL